MLIHGKQRRTARLVISALGVFLLLGWPATPAIAGAPTAWQDRAIATATRVFHPTCGPMTISFEDASQSGAQFPDGPADQPQSGQRVPSPVGWAIEGVCVIHLDRAHRWLGYPEFCHVVLHEAGNVVGYGDDWSNPRSIRYPDPTIARSSGTVDGRRVVHWSGVDRRCLRPRDRG